MNQLHPGQGIVVFGASGATGRLILEELAKMPVSVTAVVRPGSESALSSYPGLKIVQGSPTDLNFIKQVIKKGDIVISALGQNRATRCPWAAMKSPVDLLERSAKAIMEAADANEAARFIYVSAYGVGRDWGKLPWWMRLIINMSNVKHAYRDHGKAEAVISQHATASTILKPVILVDGNDYCEPVEIEPGNSPSPLAKINRKAIAKYIVTKISKKDFLKLSLVELRGI